MHFLEFKNLTIFFLKNVCNAEMRFYFDFYKVNLILTILDAFFEFKGEILSRPFRDS